MRPAGHRGLLHHGVRRPAVLRLPRVAHVRVGDCHSDGQAKVHHQTGVCVCVVFVHCLILSKKSERKQRLSRYSDFDPEISEFPGIIFTLKTSVADIS